MEKFYNPVSKQEELIICTNFTVKHVKCNCDGVLKMENIFATIRIVEMLKGGHSMSDVDFL